jgi:hypothetical protein
MTGGIRGPSGAQKSNSEAHGTNIGLGRTMPSRAPLASYKALSGPLIALSAKDLEKRAKLVIEGQNLDLGINKMVDAVQLVKQAKTADQLVKQMIAQVGRLHG